MNKEIWLSVIGWEGYYEVSNHGRVRSVTRYRPHWRGGKQIIRGKILKQIIRKDYYHVNLSFDNDRISKSVHRLVCESFHANPNKLPVTNHKDGNKLNNHASNLEWCTISHNTKHAWDIGLIKMNRHRNLNGTFI